MSIINKRMYLAESLLFAVAMPHVASGMSVALTPSTPSPEPVGTTVTWTATVSGANPGTLWYRFRVRGFGAAYHLIRAREIGTDFHVIKDYGPGNTLDWTASDHEGLYEVEVTARNISTGDTAVAGAYFQMQPRVTGDQPVINTTSHPMVFLYSAPSCPEGARMKVQFQDPNGVGQSTPYKACQPGISMNFYLAGLRGQTQYQVTDVIDTGAAIQNGPVLTLTTPQGRSDLAAQTLVTPPLTPITNGILLQATLFTNALATDLSGNLLWYYPGNITFITRPDAGGYFFGIVEDATGDQSHQVVREFDLVGMTVLETNAARVNEQLVAMGKRPISSFHHEARRLPDGNILVLAAVEQILTDVQGPGPVDVLGDMIIVMDPDLQVLWTWNAFDHLDTSRLATLGDVCAPGDCPPFYLSSTANDWLHGNSVQETSDGNLLYSSRAQDWVFKIDYNNGNGSGNVIWRLGKDGDFTINSSDPYPWFSHQHDPQFEAGSNSLLTVFDDGNVRQALDPTANSRGQVLQLDEVNMVANLILNADLGQYSFALGAEQKLPDGNYHFDNGFLSDGTSMSVEVDPSGNIVYALHAGAPEYRSFRMQDLYTP